MCDTSSEIKTSIIEHTGPEGITTLIERFERIVPVEELKYSRENVIGCEPCHRYGKNLACPPYSPEFPDYIGDARNARVICYRVHMENVKEKAGEMKYRTAHKLVREILMKELYTYRKKGNIIAGAGPCLACKECVALSGKSECRNPSKLVYSLESLGVNLISLSEDVLGIRLQWGSEEHDADNVAAIGAVFS